jgi:hypothetical protein
MHYGFMPENGIDHIDRDNTDNLLENLREVSQSCNMRNIGISPANKSGVLGVCWHKDSGMWISQISVKGKSKYSGVYQDFSEAVAHRLAAEQCLGWPNCHSATSAYLYMKEYLNGKERR